RLRLDGQTAVLMDAPPPHNDVRPFLAIDSVLRNYGLSAPEVLSADEEAGLVLLEDLGDDTYGRMLAQGGDEGQLYRLAVDTLIHLHRNFRPERTGIGVFDEARALREVELLLDWYWPSLTGKPADAALRNSYRAAWRSVLPARDAAPRTLAVLDFQDAVLGPVSFDLVSLLEDARRDVPVALGEELIEHYLDAFPELDEGAFRISYAVIGAQRSTRIIGTFSRLKLRDSKPGYLAHIPRVWR